MSDRRTFKVLKLAEQLYAIPALKSYMRGTRDIKEEKIHSILKKAVNFNNNKSYEELVSMLYLIANTERALLEKRAND